MKTLNFGVGVWRNVQFADTLRQASRRAVGLKQLGVNKYYCDLGYSSLHDI